MIFNNNAAVNNIYGTLQHFILILKTATVTRKDFFGINRQFGHVPTESFQRPDLGNTVQY
jgi:hypothetical protein